MNLAEELAWGAVDLVAELGGPLRIPSADAWSPLAHGLLREFLATGHHCGHNGPWVVAAGQQIASCVGCLSAPDRHALEATTRAAQRCAVCGSGNNLTLYGGSCHDGLVIALVAVCGRCDAVSSSKRGADE
ncbi:hypothetical protein [Plantibacter sp. CFBP 8804]|uniref:hypothetical protein n=1 Tax=Plantibacter sp. CFBP 8804 TaxID=2775270 RepID=UPI00178155C9|nr:hypothetical protein [Plantibacter sp. CFBP 8804]MBD8515825.1 hypothetical protein [Plantibacter sp. CFBP 8804]